MMRLSKRVHGLLLLAAIALPALLNGPAVEAATITVDSTDMTIDADACTDAENDITIADLPGPDGETSLPEAICAANGSAGADVIKLTDAVYSIDEPHNYWYGPTGLPAIASEVTIEGNGAVIERADGTPKLRLFYVAGELHPVFVPKDSADAPLDPTPGDLTLRNLTLRDGLSWGGHGGDSEFSGGGGAGLGGAIYNQGTLLLEGVTASGNEAKGGSSSGGDVSAGGGGLGASGSLGGGGFNDARSSIDGGDFLGGEGGGSGDNFDSGDGGTSDIGGDGGDGGRHPGGGGGFVADGQDGHFGGSGADGGGDGGFLSTDRDNAGGGAFGGGGGGGTLGAAAGGGGVGGGGGGAAHPVDGDLGGGFGGFGGGGGGSREGVGGGGGFGGGGGSSNGNGGDGGFGGGGSDGGDGGGFAGDGGTSDAGGGGAGLGGVIFNHFGAVTVHNTTLSANTAAGGAGDGGGAGLGGAVFNLNGTVTVESSTLAGNTVTGGNGVSEDGQGAGASIFHHFQDDGVGNTVSEVNTIAGDTTLTLKNAILADSTADPADPADPDTFDAGNDCFKTDGTTVTHKSANLIESNATGDNACGSAALTADPQLGALAHNGGPTDTLALDPDSPAVNAAHDCPPPDTDQRGLGRPEDGTGNGTAACDLGAFELRPLAISVDKSSSTSELPETGATVTYTFTVENTGEVAFDINALDDDQFDTLTGDAGCQVTTTLDPNQSCSFDADLDVPAGTTGEDFVNSFTATGVNGNNNTGAASDGHTVTYTDVAPTVAATKTSATTEVPETGATVTYTFTVENTGEVAFDITALDDHQFGALTGDADCQVSTTLDPNQSCSFDADLNVPAGTTGDDFVNTFTAEVTDKDGTNDSASDGHSVTYVTPELVMDPTALDFGEVVVGETSDARVMTLENTGSADLELDPLALSGPDAGDYALGNDNCSGQTLTPGADCTFEVSLTPSAAGTRSAQVEIASNPPDSPDAVALTGTGIEPVVTLDQSVFEFELVPVGETDDATVIVTNSGDADLIIEAITNPGEPFAITGGSCTDVPVTLTPGETCDIVVAFEPVHAGDASASFDIESNAASSPDTVTLRGVTEPITVPILGRFGLLLLGLILGVLATTSLSRQVGA